MCVSWFHLIAKSCLVCLIITEFLSQCGKVSMLSDKISMVAFPQLQLLFHVVRYRLLFGRALQPQEIYLIPFSQIFFDTEVIRHIASKEGKIVSN